MQRRVHDLQLSSLRLDRRSLSRRARRGDGGLGSGVDSPCNILRPVPVVLKSVHPGEHDPWDSS